jgi:hypothetical protein
MTDYTNAILIALTDDGANEKGFDTPEEALQKMLTQKVVGNVVIQPNGKLIEWVFVEINGIIMAGMELVKAFQTGETGGRFEQPRYGFEGKNPFEMDQPKPNGQYRCGFVYCYFNETTRTVEARDGYVDSPFAKVLKKYGAMPATNTRSKEYKKNPKDIFTLFGVHILTRLADCGFNATSLVLDRNIPLKDFVSKYKLTEKDMV